MIKLKSYLNISLHWWDLCKKNGQHMHTLEKNIVMSSIRLFLKLYFSNISKEIFNNLVNTILLFIYVDFNTRGACRIYSKIAIPLIIKNLSNIFCLESYKNHFLWFFIKATQIICLNKSKIYAINLSWSSIFGSKKISKEILTK